MSAGTVVRGTNPSPSSTSVERSLREEGLDPHAWGNGPDDVYAAHAHPHHKVLVCVSGGMVFHTAAGDLELGAGDRLELPPLVEHSATVGPDGVECVEAYRR